MNSAELLAHLEAMGVRIAAVDGSLRLDAPEGVVTPAVAEEVRGRKDELLALVEARSAALPLAASGASGPWRLSPGQRRLWSLLRGSPEDTSYNLPIAYRLRGPLDLERMDRALLGILSRHEVLRAPVVETGGEPMHVPGEMPSTVIDVHDLSDRMSDSENLDLLVRGAAQRPFDLGAGPFLRATIWRLGLEDHVLLLLMHHLVSDGWSFLVLVDELATLYGDGNPTLPKLAVEYRDISEWQHRSMSDVRGEELRRYWNQRFTPSPQRAIRTLKPKDQPDLHLNSELGNELVSGLEAASAQSGGTLLMATLACFGFALQRWSGHEDCVVCVPAACREQPETAGVIGYVNNVLPVRFSLQGLPSFDEALSRVRSSVLGAYAHRQLPLQEIAALPSVRRAPLTQAMLSLQDEPMRVPRLGDLDVDPMTVAKDAPNFDVSLSLERHPQGLTVKLGSRGGAVSRDEGRAILDHFAAAVTRAGHNPSAPPWADEEPLAAGTPARQSRSGPESVSIQPSHHAEPWMQAGMDEAPESDALVAQLIMIWESVMAIAGITADSNFFELGGHSLLAVSLIEAIERETGHVLSLATLVEHPEVRNLAAYIRARGWSPPEGILVEMAGSTVESPVFLFHSFEGHVFFYNTLAQALDRPVFGLQAVGIGGTAAPLDTVEEMAEQYLAEIRRVQPVGPYRLCAMCFGIAPALEVGRLLWAQSEDCDVVFIDSAFEHLDPSPVAAVERRLSGPLLKQMRARAWLLRERVRRWNEIRQATPYLRREMRLKDSIVRAWYRYEPTAYPGRVTLIRSQESEQDPTRSWQVPALDSLTPSRLATVVVPGDHFTILRQPRVSHVAQAILRAGTPTE